MNVDVSKLSAGDLEKLLAEKKKEERTQRLQAKVEYEGKRDMLVTSVVDRAKVMHNQLKDFKHFCVNALENFRAEADAYGDIRKTSKGGFSLRHSGNQEMVSLDRNVVMEYDERAATAETLIKEFMEDKVKKRDAQTYRTIAALLERNKQGDYTPGRVASLLKIKDNYNDERWIKAMQLFEESFRVRDISYSVSFFRKNAMEKDEAIVLTLASIPVERETQNHENSTPDSN